MRNKLHTLTLITVVIGLGILATELIDGYKVSTIERKDWEFDAASDHGGWFDDVSAESYVQETNQISLPTTWEKERICGINVTIRTEAEYVSGKEKTYEKLCYMIEH